MTHLQRVNAISQQVERAKRMPMLQKAKAIELVVDEVVVALAAMAKDVDSVNEYFLEGSSDGK